MAAGLAAWTTRSFGIYRPSTAAILVARKVNRLVLRARNLVGIIATTHGRTNAAAGAAKNGASPMPPKPHHEAEHALLRGRDAIRCSDPGCGLVEVWPQSEACEQCPSCGQPVERVRTITREECDVCGLVRPYTEYDGRFVVNGCCAHRAMSERVYVCMKGD